jgi:non-specific serine/threonine protein kinase
MAGELSDAAEHVRDSIAMQRGDPIPPLLAQAVELAAWIAADAGAVPDLRHASVVFGAADRIWQDSGLRNLRDAPYFQRMHERCEAKIRAGLSDTAFEAAFARGAGMSIPDVAAEIIGADAGKPPDARAGDAEPVIRLTAREQEVADLIAAGLSNRQIAGRLVVSPRTAESHVQSILTKLGFTSRSQVASYLAARRQVGRRDQP